MKILKLITLIPILTIFACDKNCYESSRNDNIFMGDITNMLVTQYDTFIIGNINQEASIEFDMNRDNVSDFRLTSKLIGLPYNAQKPETKFLCLNSNCKVYEQYSTDTIFYRHYEDILYSDDWPNIISITHRIGFSCYRMTHNNSDSIFCIQPATLYPHYFYSTDEISRTDTFLSDTINLNVGSDGFNFENCPPTVNSGGPYIENDIPVYYQVSYHYSCHAIPNNEIVYLGIKLTDSFGEKLGWIKLALMDRYKLLIFETAIQE
ncbi:MAG: hypothetical protein JW798_08865 [Prolixibacteraceae bacterium]|nr:hypothetical protein [Prolixibacteraceae bacterium]